MSPKRGDEPRLHVMRALMMGSFPEERGDHMNPKQSFVILAVSREDIATILNDEIEDQAQYAKDYKYKLRACFQQAEFKPDDSRLTDDRCTKFVEALRDVYTGDFNEDDRIGEFSQIAVKLLQKIYTRRK